MRGFSTNVSDLYNISSLTTAAQILPKVQVYAPSLINTLDSRAHFY